MKKTSIMLAALMLAALMLAACSPKVSTETVPAVNCTKITVAESCTTELAFNQIERGMASAAVINALGKGWRTTDSNSIGQYEFKTLQWENCGTLFSVTFKNDAVDSKFMIGDVR